MQLRLRHAGGLGQHALGHGQYVLSAQHLGLQGKGAGTRLIGIGHGFVAQGEAVLRLGQGAVDGALLLAQQVKVVLGQHQVKVAPGGEQQQVAACAVRLQFGHVGGKFKLAGLCAAFAAAQALARRHVPARAHARVDRGIEVHPVGRRNAGRGKVRTRAGRIGASQTGASAQHHLRAPQR